MPARATGEYSLCSEEEVGAHVRTLYRWHGRGMAQPLERAAWRGISGGVCRDDEGLDNFGGGADGDGRGWRGRWWMLSIGLLLFCEGAREVERREGDFA